MKKIDKTILSGSALAKEAKQRADQTEDAGHDMADEAMDMNNMEEDNFAHDTLARATEWRNFAKDSQVLNFKAYKIGLHTAFDQYLHTPRSVNTKDLKKKIFDSSKKVCQKEINQQKNKQKLIKKATNRSKEVLHQLVKKSLAHTYRGAYLKTAMKTSMYEDEMKKSGDEVSIPDDIKMNAKDIDKAFKPTKSSTKYVKNYVIAGIQNVTPQNFTPVNDFKKFLKTNVTIMSNGTLSMGKQMFKADKAFQQSLDSRNHDAKERLDKLSNHYSKLQDRYLKHDVNLPNSTSLSTLKKNLKKYKYLNTEPVTKLYQQIKHQKAIQNNKNIYTPSQIYKHARNRVGKISSAANDEMYEEERLHVPMLQGEMQEFDNARDKWNLFARLAKYSSASQHPLIVYKQGFNQAKKSTNKFLNKEFAYYHEHKPNFKLKEDGITNLSKMMSLPKFKQDLNQFTPKVFKQSKQTYQKARVRKEKQLLKKIAPKRKFETKNHQKKNLKTKPIKENHLKRQPKVQKRSRSEGLER